MLDLLEPHAQLLLLGPQLQDLLVCTLCLAVIFLLFAVGAMVLENLATGDNDGAKVHEGAQTDDLGVLRLHLGAHRLLLLIRRLLWVLVLLRIRILILVLLAVLGLFWHVVIVVVVSSSYHSLYI